MDSKILLVWVLVFGLLVGGGGAYALFSGQISSLTSEKSILQEHAAMLESQLNSATAEKASLESQLNSAIVDKASLQTAKKDLEEQVNILTQEKTNLCTQINAINKEKQDALDKYNLLLDTLNATVIKNWIQTIQYNISAGTNKVWTFVIPERGILWDVEIQFSATYVGMIYSWRQGDKRGFVGSSGMSLVAIDHPYLPYYGPQQYLYGTIKVNYFDDGKGRLWVDAYLTTQFDQINRGGEAYFDY